jgi:hypothetical protein
VCVIEVARQFADMREAGIGLDQSPARDNDGMAWEGETKDTIRRSTRRRN